MKISVWNLFLASYYYTFLLYISFLFILFITFLLDYRDAYGECVRLKCPTDQIGDYQPHCKLVPRCPSEYPGNNLSNDINYEKIIYLNFF